MECIKIILLLAIGITVCHAYSFMIRAKQPGVCYYNGVLLQKGDNQMPGRCQNAYCNEDGSVFVEGCGRHSQNDCLVLNPMNLGRPYPECCTVNPMCGQGIPTEGGLPMMTPYRMYPTRLYALV